VAQVDYKIVLDTYNSQFDYKSFAILCAVSSLLGKQAGKFKLITSKRYNAEWTGSNVRIFLEEEVKSRGVKIIEIPYRELLRKIDAVSKLGYFSKYTYHKKHTYYSSFLKKEQIMKSVYNRKYNAKRKTEKLKAYESSLEQGLQNVSIDTEDENASQPHEIVHEVCQLLVNIVSSWRQHHVNMHVNYTFYYYIVYLHWAYTLWNYSSNNFILQS